MALVPVEDDDDKSLSDRSLSVPSEMRRHANKMGILSNLLEAGGDELPGNLTENDDARTDDSMTSYKSVVSDFSVHSSRQVRLEKEKLLSQSMRFRIYSADLARWFDVTVFRPAETTIEQLKSKIFVSTGFRPHYQRLWHEGNALRNDFLCADLPFQPYIRHGDPGLLLTAFVSVDDKSEGFRCEMNEESVEAIRRFSKPEMYPQAKNVMLTEWSLETMQGKYEISKIKLAEARRQNAIYEQTMEQTKFRASQCLVQGAIEREAKYRDLLKRRDKQAKELDHTNKRVRLYFEDMIRYFLLLTFFQLALSFGPNGDPTKFDTLSSIRKSYDVPVSAVNSHKEFWQYVEGRFLNTTIPDRFYNGTLLPDDKKGYTLYNNYIVGTLKLRQIRSQVDVCLVPVQFLRTIAHCYAPHSEALQDTKPFGPSSQYKFFAELDGTTDAKGQLVVPYGAGGQSVDLPKTATEARVVLASMKKQRWLDIQTRAVILQWTMYNPSKDMFFNVQILFEMPAFGGVYSKTKFMSLQPIRYAGEGVVVLCLEIMVIVQVAANLHREYSLWKDWFGYSVVAYGTFVIEEDPHRIMDWFNYMMCITIFCLRMYEWLCSELLEYNNETGTLAGFFVLYELNGWDVFLQSINASQMWFKAFKYMCIFHTPSVFNEIYGKVFEDLSQFTIMFTTMALVFAQAGMIFFGARSDDFSTFNKSLYTLFNMLTGKVSAFELDIISPGWGIVFYVVYMFSQIYCFLNYVYGIFNYALLNALYSEKPENYFGWHVREFAVMKYRLLRQRAEVLRFWDPDRKIMSASQIEKVRLDLERKRTPEDLHVHDHEIESVKFTLRHLHTLVGQEAVLTAIQDQDTYGTCNFDKAQVRRLLEYCHRQIQNHDSLGHINVIPYKEWDSEVGPIIFAHLDKAQRLSRSTKYKMAVFKELEEHFTPST